MNGIGIKDYPIDTLVTLSMSLTTFSNGQPVDPDDLSLYVLPPNGVIQTYVYGSDPEIVRDNTGMYHANILGDASGMWLYKWQAGGNIQVTSYDRRFMVIPSELIAG